MANPSPIIQTFYAEDSVFNDVKLDGVVTLVDAKHAAFHLDEVKPEGIVNEAIEQIAYADRIIVNKVFMIDDCFSPSRYNVQTSQIKLRLGFSPNPSMLTILFTKFSAISFFNPVAILIESLLVILIVRTVHSS